MHVSRSTPDTWQVRAPEALAARHGVTERALRWYRKLSTPSVLAGIRKFGQRWNTRIRRARCATQTPSALERLYEDACVFKAAGATAQDLRTLAVDLNQLITDLEEQPGDHARVLAALHACNLASQEEARAESLMLTRAHGRRDEADVDRVIDATRHAIAAHEEQLAQFTALKREQARARHGMVAIRGGLAR